MICVFIVDSNRFNILLNCEILEDIVFFNYEGSYILKMWKNRQWSRSTLNNSVKLWWVKYKKFLCIELCNSAKKEKNFNELVITVYL